LNLSATSIALRYLATAVRGIVEHGAELGDLLKNLELRVVRLHLVMHLHAEALFPTSPGPPVMTMRGDSSA
jgi:hypothetical protein